MATFVITGTAKGIGLELTRQLSLLPESEVKRIFAITRSEPSEALQSVIKTGNGRVTNILASVTDIESIRRAANEIESYVGINGVDCLVNNAGVAGVTCCGGGVADMQTDHMERCFDTNVSGVHRMTTTFLPLLRDGKQKKVINMYVCCQRPRLTLACIY